MDLAPLGIVIIVAFAVLIGGGIAGYAISIYNTLVQVSQGTTRSRGPCCRATQST